MRELEPVATPSFPETIAMRAARYSRGEADIEFPLEAVGTDLAALTTIAIGGVYSIKGFSGIRIVDMKLPPEFGAAHPGPQFGIEGSRALTGVRGPADHRLDRQAGARACVRTRPPKWCASWSRPTSISSRTTKS